ncbi:MFS transporter [Streptomyces amakusaensis]|uniref:MFS transporter n=1 Tax=Streptomyces amakusaensis TaxID=67271 RepID=A0ABW0AU36_9ACTN
MTAPSCVPSYSAVLRTRYACRTFGAALLGRLSYGMVSLSLLLAIAGGTGSYAVAGTVMALFGLTSVFLSPLRAALVDRHGPGRALPPMAIAYALLLGALAQVTWQPGASGPLLGALAAAAGACTPPLGPVMRTLWSDLLPDKAMLRRAYSLDSIAEEILFVTGPLLVGVLASAAVPAAGVAASAVLILVGTLALVRTPPVRAAAARRAERGPVPKRPRRRDSAAGGSRPRVPISKGLHGVIAVSAGVGLCLGALELLVVAFADRLHQPGAVPWVLAALSAGSAVGGLVYGAVDWRGSDRSRLGVLAAGLALVLATAGLAPNLYVFAALTALAGVFVAPAMTTAYMIADRTAAPESRTRDSAWVNTALNAGISGGTAGVGLLVGQAPLALCFALAAAPALLTAVGPLIGADRAGEGAVAEAAPPQCDTDTDTDARKTEPSGKSLL